MATHLPESTLPELGTSDKLSHMAAFAGLSFLLAWAIPTRPRLRHSLLVCSVGACYAALDELTQWFIPGRACDIYDFAADCLGIAAGLLIYTLGRQALLGVQWGRRLITLLAR